MQKLAFTFLLYIIPAFCFSEFDFNDKCKEAYKEILNLRFDKGKSMLQEEEKDNPSNDIPYFIENYVDFLTIIIGEEKPVFDKLKINKSIRLVRLEKADKSSPYYRYCLAEVYMQWAFSRIKFREYLTAAYEINKAYRLLEKNATEFPDFMLNKQGLGLLHVLIGAIPDEYKWISNVLSLEGNINAGVNELETVYSASLEKPEWNYLNTEISFTLTFVYINLWNDKSSLDNIESNIVREYKSVTEIYPPLVRYCLAKIALYKGNNDRAIEILSLKPEDEQFPFYYLDYLSGITLLNRLDDKAIGYFTKYVNKFKGQNYIKSSYEKIAWYYLLHDDVSKYNEYITHAKLKGNTTIDEDKQAEKEALNEKIPNTLLLRARLFCDGGYYDKALEVLLNKKNTELYVNPENYLEFTYRLARIYHEWGRSNDAIPYYEITINTGSDMKFYFAANSCLQLGLIYESKHNSAKAKYYYDKCLSMKNDEYRNSIRQKAKAGIRRIMK